MLLRRLELTDVRSYVHTEVAFDGGVTVLIGRNAHGKTNLLEAAHRVAVGSSHRVSSDTPLVRRDAGAGYVRTQIETDEGRRRSVELELRPGRGTRARVDGQDVRRSADAIGVLRAVMFAPEDLSVVRGDPGERRRFLDEVLAQRRPAFALARGEYDRVLRQRNQLLKSARGLDHVPGTLETWTDELVRHGSVITAARIALVHALAGPAAELYGWLVDQPEPIEMTYVTSSGPSFTGVAGDPTPDPGELAEQMRAAIADAARDERARGLSLVGPHRDELDLQIRELPARGYASHGQLWSLALALRLATYDVLAEVGDRPIVLLDDVFAELDETRRQRLADACADWDQVIVTSAVDDDVPLEGPRLDVVMHDGVSSVTARGDL